MECMTDSNSEFQPGLDDPSHTEALHSGLQESVKQMEPIDDGETRPGHEQPAQVDPPAQAVDKSLAVRLFGGWLGMGDSRVGLQKMIDRLRKKNPGQAIQEVVKKT